MARGLKVTLGLHFFKAELADVTAGLYYLELVYVSAKHPGYREQLGYRYLDHDVVLASF